MEVIRNISEVFLILGLLGVAVTALSSISVTFVSMIIKKIRSQTYILPSYQTMQSLLVLSFIFFVCIAIIGCLVLVILHLLPA